MTTMTPDGTNIDPEWAALVAIVAGFPAELQEQAGEILTEAYSYGLLRGVKRCAPPAGVALLSVPAPSLKMLRETLCLAQQMLAPDYHDVTRVQSLIDDIDRQRPLGPDGKHGDRHTPTCGCEDVPAPAPERTAETP